MGDANGQKEKIWHEAMQAKKKHSTEVSPRTYHVKYLHSFKKINKLN